jgi:hypothetical protein
MLFCEGCSPPGVWTGADPTTFSESEFEVHVAQALGRLLPEYSCGIFSGAFVLEGERHVADLALIHRSLSHWFVVEVELAWHSLEGHVLPQVRCFRYGDAEPSCTASLTRAFPGMERGVAAQLIDYIPRYVAVVGNLADSTWSTKLSALDVQYLTLAVYGNDAGETAYGLDGQLETRLESLGFAQFSAIDNCLRIPRQLGLRAGGIQVVDQFGSLGDWTVRQDGNGVWLCKDSGPALIPHNSYVQLMRGHDGRLRLRPCRN